MTIFRVGSQQFRERPFVRNLSGPVLRDTARLSQRYPPIARYGVFGVSTWPIGCDTPSPFSECFPLGKHAKWRCDTPPQKGYLSDTCAIPYENKGNGCYSPLCDTISKGYCAIWGGISHWAAKFVIFVCSQFWESLFAILAQCSQFCLRPFHRNSRGNPSLCWLGEGGVKGHQNCEQTFCEQTGVC